MARVNKRKRRTNDIMIKCKNIQIKQNQRYKTKGTKAKNVK